MTTIAAGAASRRQREPGRLPWTRMIWVTWRQHRAALGGLTVLAGGFAVVMVVIGLRARAEYAALPYCGRVGRCSLRPDMFDTSPFDTYPVAAGFALHAVPALVGMFLGAPLLARELESGTFQFAWTQGMGRARWTALKLLLLAVPVAAGAGVLGMLFAWSYQPYVPLGVASGWQSALFDVSGLTLAGWALLGFALGALAGLVLRRIVAAMASTAACIAALAALTWWQLDNLLLGIAPLTARTAPYYAAPGPGQGPITLNAYALRDTGRLTGGWLVSGWFTGPGRQQMTARVYRHVNNAMPGNNGAAQMRWLARHHDGFWVTYQAAGRFWAFQGIDGAALVLVALILGAVAVWLVRRPAA